VRENRTHGSEGGEAKSFPTPIVVKSMCCIKINLNQNLLAAHAIALGEGRGEGGVSFCFRRCFKKGLDASPGGGQILQFAFPDDQAAPAKL